MQPVPYVEPFTCSVVPFTYDPSMSVYEILCKVMESLQSVLNTMSYLDIDELNQDITALGNLLESINSTEYPETIEFIETTYIKHYNTVSDMLNDSNIKSGMVCHTNGFRSQSDNGGCYYIIKDIDEQNNYSVFETDNGKYAHMLKIAPYVTPEMFGAYGDGIHDDSEYLNYAFNFGLPVKCVNKYLIKQDVSINNDDDPSYDNDEFIRTTVEGKSSVVTLYSSNVSLNAIRNEATFIFDGGSFIFRGTAGIAFTNCIFMGTLNRSKQDTAFKLISPARKLHINNCVFCNLEYGIYNNNQSEIWSGEHVIKDCYFLYSKYGIYLIKSGYDSIVSGNIFQGSVETAFYGTRCMNLLYTLNHDYSEQGSWFERGANIVNNYFDGFNKLHLTVFRTTLNSKVLDYGFNVVGNTFFIGTTATDDDKVLITIHSNIFICCNISNNQITGSKQGTGRLAFIDVSNCTTIGHNYITNNIGEQLTALFKGAISSQSNYYKEYGLNNYNNVSFEVTNGACDSYTQQIHYTNNGIIAVLRMYNVHYLGVNSATLINVPPSAHYINEYIVRRSDDSIYYASTGENYVYVSRSEDDSKYAIATIYVTFGTEIGSIAYTI